MLQEKICDDGALASDALKGRAQEIAAAVSSEDLSEIERVLSALSEPGSELHFHPDLPRAMVWDLTSTSDKPRLVTALSVVKVLDAVGWTRPVPSRTPTIKRAQITPAGLESLERIRSGNDRVAEAREVPELAPVPVTSRAALRAELAKLPEGDRLEYCLDILDQFIGEDLTVQADWVALGVNLSPAELRLTVRLAADRDRTVRHGVLQYVTSIGRTGEIVSPEAVRKLVHSVRMKLKRAGLPIEIRSLPAVGYAITAPSDFNIPGEEAGL